MNKIEKKILIMLAMAQFILTLDSTVMTVSISTLVVDLNTTVSGIQAAITFYTLVMAAFMIPGAKIGDMIGRKKAFMLGVVIYGTGSFITAISQGLPSLLFGWSLLEGLGAALMIPAMLSLIASNYPSGPKRVKAYATVAAIGAIGAAVGPIVGGLLTTYATWRLAFLGEVAVVIYILLKGKVIKDSALTEKVTSFDWVGTILSASGLSVLILGILQASKYGLFVARQPVIYGGQEIIPAGGVSPTVLLTILGFGLLAFFAAWQNRRKKHKQAALIDMSIFKNKIVRSGTGTIFFQLMLLGGVMYGLSLYLQMQLGYNAIQTGVTMLPLSAAILLLASRGSIMAGKFSSRTIVRVGFTSMLLGSAWLGYKANQNPDGLAFLPSLALFGAGMGMIASQLQNTVQNSVDEKSSAETSGLMSTFQFLGQSFGTAISGVLIVATFISVGTGLVAQNPDLNTAQKEQLTMAIETQPQILSDADVEKAVADLPPSTAQTVTDINAETRQAALSGMFVLLSVLSLFGLLATKNLPAKDPKAA